MSRTAATLALVCALVGLAASGTAAYVHYRMLHDPTYVSFCDVSEKISCTQVYASRFSTLSFGGPLRGIPVAVFGGIWFALATLLAAAALVGRPAVSESVPGYLFAGSTLALAVILYLAYASFFLLKLVCIVCLTTYAAVVGLFLVSGAATSVPMMSLPRRAANDLKVLVTSPLALVLALLFAGGSASALAFFPRSAGVPDAQQATDAPLPTVTQDQRSELERFMATAPRVPLVVPAQGAKVLVVKFNDFQCPACGQSYLAYKSIFAKYDASNPGAVRLVLKDYPLNPECNSSLTTMLHPAACDAAVAVRLARQHNRGPEMEDWLYTHQQGMTPQTVRQAARDIGMVTDLEEKYASTIELVKGDIALGKQLNVNQTPTFFVNGVKIDGAMAPQFFDQAIAYELQHAK
jgi:uncharacterized membrane protein/predicted DsbA family dithiol-disulfide isomerase